jgi:hypothetical protein
VVGDGGVLCGKLWFYGLEVLVDSVDMIHSAGGRRVLTRGAGLFVCITGG